MKKTLKGYKKKVKDKSVVIAGKARLITPAILSDEATLHVSERQLIFNPVTSGNSRILTNSRVIEKD